VNHTCRSAAFTTRPRQAWRNRNAAPADRCARTYKPLFHERLAAWSERGQELLTDKQWLTFTLWNPEPISLRGFGWWRWDGPWPITNDEELMGRFTGHREGLDEFLDLSNTASTLIREFASEEIQGEGRYDDWLHLMHRTALLYPSMLLEVEQAIWTQEEDDNRTWEAQVADWQLVDGVALPRHPVVHRLKYNVFSSSCALLRMILNPESIRTWEDPVEGFPANVVWDLPGEGIVDPNCETKSRRFFATLSPALLTVPPGTPRPGSCTRATGATGPRCRT
jgi:hypothetical protein